MKRLLILLAIAVSINACVPYNNYYSNQTPGYYPNASYQKYQNNSMYSNSYEQGLSEIGYDETAQLDNMSMMQQSAMPVQQVGQQTVYQELPQNPMYQNQQAKPYYAQNVQMQQQNSRGVVGIGQTLNAPVSPKTHNYENSKSKLIIPHAWRMAHPSIGKGLELADQQERFSLNSALNKVSTKRPTEVKIGREKITLLSLVDASTTNAQGFMCKDTYLLKAQNNEIKRMWGKFCRHPNWNEWVLTSW